MSSTGSNSFTELFRKGQVSRQDIQKIGEGETSGNDLITVGGWSLVLDSSTNICTATCTVTANSSDNLINTLLLGVDDQSGEKTYASCFFSTSDNGMNTASAAPVLNFRPGDLSVGSVTFTFVTGSFTNGKTFGVGVDLLVDSN